MSQFKELMVFGPARILDTCYAKRFVGEFEGTIDGLASSATADATGQNIAQTYIKGIGVDGKVVTVTKGDGSTFSFETQDTVTEVEDSLTSTASTVALSANQGYILDGRVDDLETKLTVGTF